MTLYSRKQVSLDFQATSSILHTEYQFTAQVCLFPRDFNDRTVRSSGWSRCRLEYCTVRVSMINI